MLEPIGSPTQWQWSATGKHPAFADYFELGRPLPLMTTFFGWLRKGYAMVSSRRGGGGENRSWRFWSRAVEKGSLVCGLVRDSDDGLGRPYPLLVIGQGPLAGWEDHWDLVVLACQKTWNEMESLSREHFSNLRELERTLSGVSSPESAWERLGEERERLGSSTSPHEGGPVGDGMVKAILAEHRGKGFFVIPLSQTSAKDISRSAVICHVAKGEHFQLPPNVVFMGGTSDREYLVVYRRPLSADDFVHLWST